MSRQSHLYRLKRQLRHAWEVIPSFPLIPTPREFFTKALQLWQSQTFSSLPSPKAFLLFLRRAPGRVDLPPLPTIPSLKKISRSIKRGGEAALPGLIPIGLAQEAVSTLRTRRRMRTIAGAWALIALTSAVLWISSGPLLRKAKGWQSRRLAAQAEALIDKGDVVEAVAKARNAFDLRETEPAAWHAVARVLTKANHGAQALSWWDRVSKSLHLSSADRRNYAAAALSAGELMVASEQIDWLLRQPPSPSPDDLLLAAKLSMLRGDSPASVRYSEKILVNPHVTEFQSLEAIENVLINAPPRSPSYSNALSHLCTISRSADNAASLHALRIIGAQPRRSRLSDSRPMIQPTLLQRGDSNMPSHKEVAEGIESNPLARPYDRLVALDLRIQDDATRAEEGEKNAIESFSHSNEEALTALGGWLFDHGRFETILQVIPVERAVQSRTLFLERTDSLYALGRFSELADMVEDENSILDSTLQHLLLAIARAKMGETSASRNEWERAIQTADTEQQFLTIAEFAQANGAAETADAAYSAVLIKNPHLRSAYVARLRLAENSGRTADARDLATKMAELWPEDSTSQMLQLYLGLLLGCSSEETKAAEEDATAFLQRHPRDLGAAMVLSLARLKMGQQSAALNALSEQNAPSSVPMAVRAAALAANGWRGQARQEAERLASANLLPEERALVAPLLQSE